MTLLGSRLPMNFLADSVRLDLARVFMGPSYHGEVLDAARGTMCKKWYRASPVLA